jgi:hypothetical protein
MLMFFRRRVITRELAKGTSARGSRETPLKGQPLNRHRRVSEGPKNELRV